MAGLWIGDFRLRQIAALKAKEAEEKLEELEQKKTSDSTTKSKTKSDSDATDTDVSLVDTDEFIIEQNSDFNWFSTAAISQIQTKMGETGRNSNDIILMLGFVDCVNSCIFSELNIRTIAKNYAIKLAELTEQFAQNSIYICTVNPIKGDYPTSWHKDNFISQATLQKAIRTFNTKLQESCAELELSNITFIDSYKYLTSTSFDTYDGIRYTLDSDKDLYGYISSFLAPSNGVGSGGFIPRLDGNVPGMGDNDKLEKYWIHVDAGGFNKCIRRDTSLSWVPKGSVLPNCVGYAWGRFMEILGEEPKLSTGNAKTFWTTNLQTKAYECGQTPRVGAIMCWDNPNAAGHVAIVEAINPDGSLEVSESGYGSKKLAWTNTRHNSYNWGMGNGYKLQGFIYNPAVPKDYKGPSTSKTSKSVGKYVSKSQVTSADRALTEEEMQKNARYIWQYFGSKGWSLNAVAGMLGCMQEESTINPGRRQMGWDSLPPDQRGYSLVQWTPAQNYFDWCTRNNLKRDDIDTALKRIDYELEKKIQYYTTTGIAINAKDYHGPEYDFRKYPYPKTFESYSTETYPPEAMCYAFLYCYERPTWFDPGSKHAVKRYKAARKWFEYLLPYAPGWGAQAGLYSLKTTKIQSDRVKVSFIAKLAEVGRYQLTTKGSKLNKAWTPIKSTLLKCKEDDIKVTDKNNSKTGSENGLGDDSKLVFLNLKNLIPNTTYTLTVEISDNKDEKWEDTEDKTKSTTDEDTEESDDYKATITFTTPQSRPSAVTNLSLEANSFNAPDKPFTIKLSPTTDWGYWRKNGHGYTIHLLVNGKSIDSRDVSTISSINNFIPIMNKYFNSNKIQLGDTLQFGVQSWVTDKKGQRIYDNVDGKIHTTNAVCLLNKPFVIYIKPNI